ncbi:hypothetical protein [Levilactobacillus brevis]|uniref:hypothetical protein n=1 Tax=Levilactobacillus brevis TaxID=1580 RepID=UPI0020733137|nr:hypothetical protein [Levilactobacillus brevis]
MNNFFVILLSVSSFALLISATSVFLTVYVYIENFSVSYSIIRDSIKVRFSKKEQKNRNESLTYFINFYYRQLAVTLSEKKDKDISKDLGISTDEAKRFKVFLRQMLSKNSETFMSVDDAAWLTKQNKTYSLFSQITDGIKGYSNHRMLLMAEIQEDKKLTDIEKTKEIISVLQMPLSDLSKKFKQRQKSSNQSLMFNVLSMSLFPNNDQEAFQFLYRTYTTA